VTSYSEAVAGIRAARISRDEARETLYALEIEGIWLERARRREQRGEGTSDPAQPGALRVIDDEASKIRARVAAIDRTQEAGEEDRQATEPLAAEIEAIDKRLAKHAHELSELGAALEQNSEKARLELVERIRAVQRERAELEQELALLRSEHAEVLQRAEAAAAGRQALESERAELEERLAALREERAHVAGAADTIDLRDAARAHRRKLDAARKRAARFDHEVRDARAGLWLDRTPTQLTAEWSDGSPILLLPLRIETRWHVDGPGPPELLVRAYPDDIAVATHEKALTEAELKHGRAYWTALRAAVNEDERAEAWRALALRFGANRSSWVARQTKPSNWETAKSGDALDFPETPVVKPDSWTEAPHTRVLPDCLALLGWRGGKKVLDEVGAPIDDIVVLGPAPIGDIDGDSSIGRDTGDQSIVLGDSFRWVRDFEIAVEQGMAFRVPLDADAIEHGFDRVLVIGLKHSTDLGDAQTLVEDLLDNHHYSRSGLSLMRQGTATNNTGGNEAGWSREEDGSASTGLNDAPLFEPVGDRTAATDGQRFADFLGIGYEPLFYLPGSDIADHAEAVAMNRALYAGTLGYYLDHMLDAVVDDDALRPLRAHFNSFVTGRGPIASIRVGSQPYGVLPTSAFGRWRPASERPNAVLGALRPADAAFEQGLHKVLVELDHAWTAKLPELVQIGSPGEGAANLLKVLGLHPASSEFFQRVGYSYDYLKNLESFAWDGSDFSDVLLMSMEAGEARQLLRRLGWTDGAPGEKPFPLLLQLIWRHYHTALDAKQLIDGRPLSESDGIKPYDANTGATYIDWLIANAGVADALEAQEFGTARPGFLLYMLLHFSIVMEASKGLHTWLGEHDIRADELVRSRKFLNIGAKTPTTWEIFKAPASRVAPKVKFDRSLLEVLNTPAFAKDAGDGVQDQRAGLEALRRLPTARLERALVEHIDTLSYRLDAWQTSLFTRRLHQQRGLDLDVGQRRTGLYLGAFGYVENARPAREARTRVTEDRLPEELRLGTDSLYEETGSGGFVHAPSINHANAAALLRNGYLTHATPDRPDALAVNLSSARVRRAEDLLDGIRGGQSLEVLLGIMFERGLHEWTTRPGAPVILDQLKPAFRTAFPIRRTRVPQAADSASGAAEIAEDHQVTDGLALARTKTPYPYGIAELASLSTTQRDAILAEKRKIEGALDALSDVLTAEAAYQLALGNFERAAAALQCIGSATAPPDIEVLRTPRGTGISFTNRLAVQLSAAVTDNPWPSTPMTARALLEPALNHWLGDLLGDPQTIRCLVTAVAPPDATGPMSGLPAAAPISLADLQVQPIDLVYLARSQTDETGLAELEQRVRYAFARTASVPDEAIIRIAFADAGSDPSARPFGEVLPLADRLRRLLGASKPLDARHFQSASKDAPAPPDNPGVIDIAELHARVKNRLSAVRSLFPVLSAAADVVRAGGTSQTELDNVRNALSAIAATGFGFAVPVTATGASQASAEALVAQADSVLARGAALEAGTDDRLAAAEAAAEGAADMKAGLLTEAAKAWFGANIIVLPKFQYLDPLSVGQADAAREPLLAAARGSGSVLPIEEWLHGVACVRPQVHAFEIVRAMADTARADPLPLSAIQLPYRTGDSWLAAQFPATMEIVHDTVSIVQHLPQGFAEAGLQCGLLIDEWVETIPTREEVTGLTFNYNAPNSAPAQALLLAVTPELTGSWSWDDLVETILDTFRRAKARAIEPDAIEKMGGIGVLLPAVMAEFSTSRGSISLDYSLVFPEIREAALTMMGSISRSGPEG
jgi:hypothetical protein